MLSLYEVRFDYLDHDASLNDIFSREDLVIASYKGR